MTDLPTTARFLLPLLATAQAQKEITHNEALTLLDALAHSAIEDGPQADPPGTAAPGQCWLVGDAATGAWTGAAGSLAVTTPGGWRFVAPRPGVRVLRLADNVLLRFDHDGWAEPAVVAKPDGGPVVDSEARAAIDALILLLSAQGLLISG
jgi:hypothetical protein